MRCGFCKGGHKLSKKKVTTVVIDTAYVETIKQNLLNRLLARMCIVVLSACLFKYIFFYNELISEKLLNLMLTVITVFVFITVLDTIFAAINYIRFCRGKVTIKKIDTNHLKLLTLFKSKDCEGCEGKTESYFFRETPLFKIKLISDGLCKSE